MKSILHYVKRFFLFFWIGFTKIVWKLICKNRSLLELKRKKTTDRVFIVCTGPSLTVKDLEMIKEYDSISMNGIVKIFNSTCYRPTYYMIQDKTVLKKIYNTINESDLNDVIIGLGNCYKIKANISKKDSLLLKKNRIYYNLNLNYHCYDMYYKNDKMKFEFSYDCEKEIFDGATVTYSAIQLALYLGYKEIILLGCDCSNLGHFDKINIENNNDPVARTQLNSYMKAYDELSKKNIRIFNSTRGGFLEVFPRKKLEDLI